MVFSSVVFLLYFLPVFLLVYHFIDRKYKNYTILLASIFFYAWGGPKFIFVILGCTAATYYMVKLLDKSENRLHRRLYLTVTIFLNLGFLVYFKYANFFLENFNSVLGSFGISQVSWTRIVLPIGISFYTFQTLTYAIDVYRKVHAPLNKVTDYLLYIMSFPQMIAGPIVRFNSIADQITDRKETVDDKLIGFYRFSIGLAKKVLIANVMAEQADAIFNSDLGRLDTANAWLGILAYTFQIYFDFAGYSDMAIGLGRMMGFRFPENFNSPYVSRNISEFWRRWHITLGSFMRDYLYIPLGGNRVSSNYRLYLNLWIVFLLSGLWHGASWNFVIWGAYHGLFLIFDRLFLVKFLSKLGTAVSILFTFLVVMVGWVIFRIETMAEVKVYLVKMFSFHFEANGLTVIPAFGLIVIFAILFSFIASISVGKKLELFVFEKNNYSLLTHFGFSIISILLFVLCVSSITSSGFNPFIYFRF